MRFIEPKAGETRSRTFFAWFPETTFSGKETRWLERVTVEERYDTAGLDDNWVIIRFVDKEAVQ